MRGVARGRPTDRGRLRDTGPRRARDRCRMGASNRAGSCAVQPRRLQLPRSGCASAPRPEPVPGGSDCAGALARTDAPDARIDQLAPHDSALRPAVHGARCGDRGDRRNERDAGRDAAAGSRAGRSRPGRGLSAATRTCARRRSRARPVACALQPADAAVPGRRRPQRRTDDRAAGRRRDARRRAPAARGDRDLLAGGDRQATRDRSGRDDRRLLAAVGVERSARGSSSARSRCPAQCSWRSACSPASVSAGSPAVSSRHPRRYGWH